VPRTAVTQGAKGHFVWVADKTNRAELRVVQVGDWHDKDIFIDSGLTAGDRVILDNLIKIYSDAPLQITETRVPDAGNGPSGRPKKP
jgi:membrane fusion protein (multidrug efflux system)